MKIRCLAIDDEMPALEKLEAYIRRVPYLELVDKCDNAIDAANILGTGSDVDAIFIDINMPDLNGLDFVDSLEHKPLVVFITAYPQYAVDSYRTGAVDYLLKPYSFDDFLRASGRLVERMADSAASSRAAGAESFFIKVDSRWVKIHPARVEYIRGYGDYLRVYLADREFPLVTYSTLNAIKAMLPPEFIQVHRSFIVNMDHVSSIERTRVATPSNNDIPVGDSFKDALTAYLSTRTVGKEPRRRQF